MKEQMISVIVPAYNSEMFIGKCIDSVLAQTYSNWELIAVDDGSRDNTFGILKKYAEVDSRIRVIHQENQGPGIARNTGIAEAKGNYVVFIDSDDYIERIIFNSLRSIMKMLCLSMCAMLIRMDMYLRKNICQRIRSFPKM